MRGLSSQAFPKFKSSPMISAIDSGVGACEENIMTNANGILSASRLSAVAGHFILGFVSASALSSAAVAERDNTVPQFASPEFGWQTNVADWRSEERRVGKECRS